LRFCDPLIRRKSNRDDRIRTCDLLTPSYVVTVFARFEPDTRCGNAVFLRMFKPLGKLSGNWLRFALRAAPVENRTRPRTGSKVNPGF
jgi:hypothetical protein